MRMHRPRGSQPALLGALGVALALMWSNAASAEAQVYLLRGWFGVFSTGLDSMAGDLRNKGINAQTVGHLAWKSTVSSIIKRHAAGQDQPANMANVAGSQAKAAAPVNSASPARFSPRTSNQTKANPANPTGNRETQGRQPVEEKP